MTVKFTAQPSYSELSSEMANYGMFFCVKCQAFHTKGWHDEVPKRDACEVCKGLRGGVPGNENIINGIVVCDYCTCTIQAWQELLDQKGLVKVR